MRRAPGWITLAGIALELCALAYLGSVLMRRDRSGDVSSGADPEPDAMPQPAPPPQPMRFIADFADGAARYYRALDESGEVVAGFFSDGRVRIADERNRRFAGLLQEGHADLLELDTKELSEMFVRVTPIGAMQLELRGGAYDGRVFTCTAFHPLQDRTAR